MAWELHVKVPIRRLETGELPREALEAYVGLGWLAMRLRGSRQGDTFVASRRAAADALRTNHWANARRHLERLARQTEVIRWREASRGRVEITIAGFEQDQGWLEGDTERIVPGGTSEARAGHGPGTGRARAGHGVSKSPESKDFPRDAATSQSQSQYKSSRGSARTRGKRGEEPAPLPDAMPEAVRQHLRQRLTRARLHVNVRRHLDDDAYLADEWARFVRHHRRAETRPGSLESLATRWFQDAKTGARAHKRTKQQVEQAAQRGLWPTLVAQNDAEENTTESEGDRALDQEAKRR